MPSSSLASYLAKNYLNADPTPTSEKKSKKRKRQTSSKDDGAQGLTIADDDADSWNTPTKANPEEDVDSPMTVSHSNSAEFRKKRTSQWQTLSGAPATLDAASASADAEADAIIASAAAENEARRAAEQDNDEEAPAIVETQIMSNGAHAGLQSASAMAAQIASHRSREAATDADAYGNSKGETIYRDASGRIVNIAMERAAARAKAEAAELKKREREEAARGDVQRVQKEERRQELEDAKLMPFARRAEDEDLNAELRAREVWGDPMAGQLEGSSAGGVRSKGDRKGKVVVKKSITGRPLYAGSAPPNRYGIRPGHKWDGVDRGIGFESRWFKARNTRKDREALEWNWQMDE